MNIDWSNLIQSLINSVIFTSLGLVFFAIAFYVISAVTPFSIRKELEDDQNTALGIVIGSVIIGIALVVSAAIS
ncbi:MAG: DUF350 domain-containing protein [Deltaproteobacteria bacterium]|nr:DUF350 domain-containing protein [Deltaproteobacteria bacterium]